MGRDRQEQKLKEQKIVESDRDQALHYKGATRLDNAEEARKENRHEHGSV
ncbi:YpzI-like protein [Bacillus oleivorans]|uniref:YpzI-like protein n=1 Tax=Bacillus oleivorans TaxID=1448271 RepID=A0A285CM45_9BACI|nr:YpzI family protein [Bacillus oleivorans]SNX68128.1 YpzI-like protein [Bacillus oleivorans]